MKTLSHFSTKIDTHNEDAEWLNSSNRDDRMNMSNYYECVGNALPLVTKINVHFWTKW